MASNGIGMASVWQQLSSVAASIGSESVISANGVNQQLAIENVMKHNIGGSVIRNRHKYRRRQCGLSAQCSGEETRWRRHQLWLAGGSSIWRSAMARKHRQLVLSGNKENIMAAISSEAKNKVAQWPSKMNRRKQRREINVAAKSARKLAASTGWRRRRQWRQQSEIWQWRAKASGENIS